MLAFPFPANANDAESVTDFVIDQMISARKHGRPWSRSSYDLVHTAILQALDEQRGISQIRRWRDGSSSVRGGPWSIIADDVRSWLQAHQDLNLQPTNLHRWSRELGTGTSINDETLFEIACCYEQFDAYFPKARGEALYDDDMDEALEAEIVAAVRTTVHEWIQQTGGRR